MNWTAAEITKALNDAKAKMESLRENLASHFTMSRDTYSLLCCKFMTQVGGPFNTLNEIPVEFDDSIEYGIVNEHRNNGEIIKHNVLPKTENLDRTSFHDQSYRNDGR